VKTRIPLFFKYLLLFVVFFGCSKDDRNQWQLAEDEYVFVEFFMHLYGKVLEGDPGQGVGDPFCCPTYSFNSSTGELIGEIDFLVNTALKVVDGGGLITEGVIVSSMSSSLIGYYELPTNPKGFRVENIEEGGIVYFAFEPWPSFNLLPNENKNIPVSVDTVTYEMNWGSVVVEVTTTYKITNHGILKKADIISY
jgi:hypothetical protein